MYTIGLKCVIVCVNVRYQSAPSVSWTRAYGTFWSDCFSSAPSWDETFTDISDNCLTNVNVSVHQKPHSGAGSTFFCMMRLLVLWTSWAPEIGRKPGAFSGFNSYSWILTTFFSLSPHTFRSVHSTYHKNCRQNIKLLSNNIQINHSTSQVDAMPINRCELSQWRNNMLWFSATICINRSNLPFWRGLDVSFDMTKLSKRFLDAFFSICLIDNEETVANISKGKTEVWLSLPRKPDWSYLDLN